MTTFTKVKVVNNLIENNLKNKFVLSNVSKEYIIISTGGATVMMLNEITLAQAYLLNNYWRQVKLVEQYCSEQSKFKRNCLKQCRRQRRKC